VLCSPNIFVQQLKKTVEISGSHGDEYEVDSLLEYGTM
jgi:hypothetical protein